MKCKGKGKIPSSILDARTLFSVGMMETDALGIQHCYRLGRFLAVALFKNTKLHGSHVVGLKSFFALLRVTVFPLLLHIADIHPYLSEYYRV